MRRSVLLAPVVVALTAAVSLADTPDWSGGGAATSPLLSRFRPFAGQNWWTRFGEPVNSAALAEDAKAGPAADVPGPLPLHGDGYVYGPGSCDCPPPCIDHLWDGYVTHPLRCNPYVPLWHRLFHRCCDDPCGKGCARGASCAAKADCGCAQAVSCATAADCGCKPACGKCRHFHLHGKWKCYAAHWHRRCDSCAATIGCGCATPLVDLPAEKQAAGRPQLPLPEDAALLSLPRIVP